MIGAGKDGEKDLRESRSKRMSKSNETSKDVEAESNVGEGNWIADVGREFKGSKGVVFNVYQTGVLLLLLEILLQLLKKLSQCFDVLQRWQYNTCNQFS